MIARSLFVRVSVVWRTNLEVPPVCSAYDDTCAVTGLKIVNGHGRSEVQAAHIWSVEDGGPDALSFAFVAIVRGKTEVWTMGMHVLGLRDIVMNRADLEADGFDIVEVIRYLSRGEKPIDDGHVLADLDGPRFQAFVQDSPQQFAGSPMHNPFGRLKLVSMRDVAETN